jgi:PLP dependent protein
MTHSPMAFATAYQQLQQRIDDLCRRYQRPRSSVQVMAVSKMQPATAIAALATLGQHAFGENYLQEALVKQQQLADLPLEWHFIGSIQSNKTRQVAENFAWVHSVDRLKIAERLSDQRPATLPPLQICLQVNVSGEASKGGCHPSEVVALAQQIVTLPRLQLRGLMAIPLPVDEPAAQRLPFRQMQQLLSQLQAAGLPLDTLSMGMTNDLEAAIECGATWLRIGTALFGRRPTA